MTFVILQHCCNDATCVEVCPVNCIHPAPGEAGYENAELLHIDPATCIDCGACAEVCPVDAIASEDDLTADNLSFLDLNADYYTRQSPAPPASGPPAVPASEPVSVRQPAPLRVAIVGSGPSACYAAEALLTRRDVNAEITMLERLPFAGGLVRYGVAPDHSKTKSIERFFARTLRRPGLSAFFDIEVGTDITIDELSAHHHAILFASGAAQDRLLGLPGENLRGCHSAREFVGWYNGHPDFAGLTFDLSHPRVVIVGNGNVALDVARILTADVERLRRTDISEYALDALAQSAVREVVLLGRRGPAESACTAPELVGLDADSSADVLVAVPIVEPVQSSLKDKLFAEFSRRVPEPDSKRITFAFHAQPAELVGRNRVTGVRVVGNGASAIGGENSVVDCGLVLRSIGYRGAAIPGLPFDDATGTVPNDAGRVTDVASGQPIAGLYVAGWIKRGPSGVIGTNRFCANETVESIVADHRASSLADPASGADEFRRLVHSRNPRSFGAEGWLAIDRHERTEGRRAGRPRVKLADAGTALDVANERGDASVHPVTHY